MRYKFTKRSPHLSTMLIGEFVEPLSLEFHKGNEWHRITVDGREAAKWIPSSDDRSNEWDVYGVARTINECMNWALAGVFSDELPRTKLIRDATVDLLRQWVSRDPDWFPIPAMTETLRPAEVGFGTPNSGGDWMMFADKEANLWSNGHCMFRRPQGAGVGQKKQSGVAATREDVILDIAPDSPARLFRDRSKSNGYVRAFAANYRPSTPGGPPLVYLKSPTSNIVVAAGYYKLARKLWNGCEFRIPADVTSGEVKHPNVVQVEYIGSVVGIFMPVHYRREVTR